MATRAGDLKWSLGPARVTSRQASSSGLLVRMLAMRRAAGSIAPGRRDTVVQVTVAAHVLDGGEETGLYYFYDAHIDISPRPEP